MIKDAYKIPPIHTFGLILFLVMGSHSLSAEVTNTNKEPHKLAQWKQCTTNRSSTSQTSITNTPAPNAIYLEADKGIISLQGTSTLQGNVIIQQNNTQFNANSATFNRKNNLVEAQGNVILSLSGLKLKSHAITYQIEEHTGIIEQAEYEIGNEGAHGKSVKIIQIDKNNLQLKDATYTTCPASTASWHLASSNIKLDKKSQIGSAKNVTFNVGKVPVFYFPWLNFPLNDQRLSGFLTPKIRLQSNAGISLPYYFNLAPNYDATLTFSTYSGRGYQLDSEFRYLTEQHQGIANYVFMPKDKSFDNSGGSQKRDYFKINHHTSLSVTSKINLIAEGVSDKEYFDDFSTSLETSSRSALQRRLEFINKQGPWKASAAFEDYQILDVNDAPYAKVPELTLSYLPKTSPKDLKLGMNSELIYFDKDNATTGSRADIKLHASKKWGTDAWFFKPSVSLKHTLYSLNTSVKSTISRTLPTLTLDTGLFFDRQMSNKNLTQTLEPRLFYTHTPYKNQSNIPIFDTSKIGFSESTQLFSENRFSGKDRIADTNQLTFAVGSRIQDRKNGKELLKASIGQIFYFNDRKVTLPNGTIQTESRSNLVLELSGRLNDNFKLSSTALWSHKKKRIPSYELRLNYQDDKKRIANIRYRKLDTELKQLSISGALPINDKWSFVVSSDHDLQNNRNLESLIGIEYQDCCWKTRLVAKRYLTSDNKTYETPIFLEFELKGLGNIGTGASRQIKDKIYGYDDY